MMNSLKTFFISIAISFSVSAAELYQAGLPPRCMAMGGTCITQVRGTDGLFFNTATLARVEGFQLTLAQLSVAVSKNAEDYVNALNNNSGNTVTSSDLQNLYGKTITADVSARAGLVVPYFGVGLYSTNYLVETFNNPAYPTFNINYTSDYGYIVGGAISLAKNTSIGVAVRSAKRWGGDKDIDVSTLVGSSNQDVIDANFPDHGSGLGLDLSFITTLEMNFKPTFALVWKDVGQTRYRMYSGQQDPPEQKDNLILGASVQHEFLLGDWTHAFEYQYIRTPGEGLGKKLHFGTEVSYGLIDLRAGLNQGYLTYGVGVDLAVLEIDATFFTNEMGSYSGQIRNDRYQIGVTLTFDFDQSFKLTNSDGKKRRLKQRR